MRLLLTIMAVSFSLQSFATVTSNETPDERLVVSLEELNARYRVARAGLVARQGFDAAVIATVIGAPAAVMAAYFYPGLRKGIEAFPFMAMLSIVGFYGMEIGVALSDRQLFAPNERLFGRIDPEHKAAQCLLGLGQFFGKSREQQYREALEDATLREFIIQLANWMKFSDRNLPIPALNKIQVQNWQH